MLIHDIGIFIVTEKKLDDPFPVLRFNIDNLASH